MKPRCRPLLIASIVACVGCGGDDTSSAPARSAAAPEQTTPIDSVTITRETVETVRFVKRMDDYAVVLSHAIARALEGRANADTRITRLRTRIRNRVNARLLEGADTSVGGNLLLSAATQARDATRADDRPGLADAQHDIASARRRLADEALIGG